MTGSDAEARIAEINSSGPVVQARTPRSRAALVDAGIAARIERLVEELIEPEAAQAETIVALMQRDPARFVD
jgi:hypothetical protein